MKLLTLACAMLYCGPAIGVEPENFLFTLKTGYSYSESPPVKLLEVDAYANPLLPENQGMFLDRGHQGYLGSEIVGHFTPYFSFEVAPYLRLSDSNTLLTDEVSFYLPRAFGTFHINQLDIIAGKVPSHWGFGEIGHFLFSDESESMPLVRLQSHSPQVLPYLFRHLGPITFDAFFAVLDKDRVFPRTRIMAMYFTFKPHSRFQFGLGQSVMFGGTGAPTNNPFVYFTEVLEDHPNPANRNFLLSARYRIPVLEIEPYVEFMLEDCCRVTNLINPRDSEHLVGIFFPRIDPTGKADAAFEWVRTNSIAYRHSPYTSGYTNKKRILGHPLGPDAMGIYARIRAKPSLHWDVTTLFAYEIRGRLGRSSGDGPIAGVEPSFQIAEQRHKMILEGNLRFLRPWTFSPKVGVQRVTNQNYQANLSLYHWLAGLDISYSF